VAALRRSEIRRSPGVRGVRAVVQSVPDWVPLTETWLHSQVRHLPDWVESHVVCGRRMNGDAFPYPRVTAGEDRALTFTIDRALRRVVPRPRGPVRRVARRVGAEVVHSHYGYIAWFDHRAARRVGARHVVSFYGFDLIRLPREDPRWLRRYARMFAGAASVLCEGPYMAGTLAGIGCDPAKVRVQRLGVDLELLPRFRPRSWSGDGPLRILMAGSFREKKGMPVALDAIGILVRAGVDARVTIVGDAGPRDADEKARILRAIDRNDLGERVSLLGYQSHSRLMQEGESHDVFLSPSLTGADGDCEGGAPVTIIEMAAIGMPVLSTLHCDIPSVLAEPNRGLLVAERDPAALADACLALLGADWGEMALANRVRIEQEFDCVTQGERLARIYFPEARAAAAVTPSRGSSRRPR
jgi:colanic acid/amylovoran biosynthesis glycosyltransferase